MYDSRDASVATFLHSQPFLATVCACMEFVDVSDASILTVKLASLKLRLNRIKLPDTWNPYRAAVERDCALVANAIDQLVAHPRIRQRKREPIFKAVTDLEVLVSTIERLAHAQDVHGSSVVIAQSAME